MSLDLSLYMFRSSFKTKTILLGESNDYNEIFSLTLDEGRGSYVFLVSVGNLSNEKAAELAYALNDAFKEKFLDQSKVLFDRFEEAILSINKTFIELVEELQLEDVGFKAAIMAESNGKVMFTRSGLAEIYLIREDELINLSEVVLFDESSNEVFDNVISGDLHKGDIYFVSNDRFLRYVSESEFVRKSVSLKFTELVEWLIEKIQFEMDGEILVGAYHCDDTVYKPLENVEVKDFKFYWKSFTRTLRHIFRSIFTGNVRSIDLDLRKKIVAFFIVLVFVFAGSSLWLAHRSVVKTQLDRYRDELEVAELIVANAKSEFDKDRIAVMLQNAEAKINSVRSFESLQDEANALMDEIKGIKSSIDNVVTVDEPELFQSVVSLSEINYQLQTVFGNSANVFASTQNRLFEFVAGVNKEPVTFDAGQGVYAYTWDKDLQALYGLTNDGTVVRVRDDVANYLDVVNEDISIGNSAKFYGGRLYVLDKDNSQIWRHDILRSSVSAKSAYLQDGYGKFVSEAKDLAIDGYIYVVTETGDFFRFLRGELDQDFVVGSKPLISLTKPDQIYTDLDNPYMFVLEASEKRIIQYFKSESRKSLEYERQYYFPNIENINSFWVDYLSNKIYLIDDRNIYVTDLIDS